MRNLIIGIWVLILAVNFNKTQAQNGNEAVLYMDELMQPFADLKGETWQYLKAVTRGKGARKVENKRQDLLSELKALKARASRKKPFQSDEDLKNAVVQYLDLTYIVLKEDFDKIINMEEIAEQSYDLMEAYLLAKEKANEKLDSVSDLVEIAQREFADKHNITLIDAKDDKITQKIKNANKALKYYNEIYLIFFKSYKQEIYVLDALSRNDLVGLEQNTSTLSSFSNEGLEKLKSASSYRGDSNLKLSAQKILKFYKKEAEEDFPAMVDFYIKKDNFEKIQKTMESKSKKSRTQQDVDQFNKAVNEFNAATTAFNKANESSNSERTKYLQEWNQKVEQFFNKYSN